MTLKCLGGTGADGIFSPCKLKKKIICLGSGLFRSLTSSVIQVRCFEGKKKKGLLVKYVWKILFTAYFLGESQSTLLGKEKSEKLRNEETGLGVFNSVFPELCEHRALTSHQLSWKFLL